MPFKDPTTHSFFSAWVDYYKTLNIDIPERAPDTNLGEISRSNKIRILN